MAFFMGLGLGDCIGVETCAALVTGSPLSVLRLAMVLVCSGANASAQQLQHLYQLARNDPR